jgi:hypothetical protein
MMTAPVGPFSAPASPILNKMQVLTRSPFRLGCPVFSYVFGVFYEEFEQKWTQRFQEHYDFIHSIVPKDKLLKYHAKAVGSRFASFWATLSRAGGFPKGNSKADLDESFKAGGQDE